ncbi:MAG: hypothetical protein F6K58_12535 [Symploca sp. SIO2E9]|nr:hypothetical protein [Symploca sp. SIO2E9]
MGWQQLNQRSLSSLCNWQSPRTANLSVPTAKSKIPKLNPPELTLNGERGRWGDGEMI